MIELKTAKYIHDILIENFGGSKGIRDVSGLEAALNRPYATFNGVDLYPGPVEKATALFESLIINHPFIDGNKRIAYVLMKFLLFNHGIFLDGSQNEKYQMVITASKGEIRFDEIKVWIESKINKNSESK